MQPVDLNSSKFYFGDLAITPTGETGEVVGIWLKECHDGQERWMYRLRGLTRCAASWWQESQLKRPSEVRNVGS